MSRNGDRETYLLDTETGRDAVERAFAWLLEQWEEPANRDSVLYVPSKRTFEDLQDAFEAVVGEETYKGLRGSENFADLGQAIQLHTMTKRIDPQEWSGGPLVALEADERLCSSLDDLPASAVFVVPDEQVDVSELRDRWSPIVLDSASA